MDEYQRGEIPNTKPYITKKNEENMKIELEQAKKEDKGDGKSTFQQFMEWL